MYVYKPGTIRWGPRTLSRWSLQRVARDHGLKVPSPNGHASSSWTAYFFLFSFFCFLLPSSFLFARQCSSYSSSSSSSRYSFFVYFSFHTTQLGLSRFFFHITYLQDFSSFFGLDAPPPSCSLSCRGLIVCACIRPLPPCSLTRPLCCSLYSSTHPVSPLTYLSFSWCVLRPHITLTRAQSRSIALRWNFHFFFFIFILNILYGNLILFHIYFAWIFSFNKNIQVLIFFSFFFFQVFLLLKNCRGWNNSELWYFGLATV